MFDTTTDQPTRATSPPDWRTEFREQAEQIEPRYSPAHAQPSGWLALEVDAWTGDDGAGLGDEDLVDAVVALDRLSSWASARQARLLAEFARRRPGDDPQAMTCDRALEISRFAPDEIGVALHLSRGTAMGRLGQAERLAGPLRDSLELWEEGRIDASKVRAICDATFFLRPEHVAAVQERVLGKAPQQTVAQLRASLARAVIALDPEGVAARHKKARRERRVVVGEEQEGMASLWAMLAAPDALSAYQWLTRLARGLGKEDSRGMDARRADLLVELLTGQLTIIPTADDEPGDDEPVADSATTDNSTGDRAESDIAGVAGDGAAGTTAAPSVGPARQPRVPVTPGKPLVQIVMPYSTLVGADDQPAELVSYGPIPADLAREIAADAVWKRLITDPLCGALLDYGRTTYRPPAALADFVRARDVYCRFPTCRRRAIDAELDHTLAYSGGGTTSEDDLYGACPHHHRLKHHGGWTVTQHRDGRIVWTAPTGHSYTSEPFDYRPEPVPARPTAAEPVKDDDDPPPFQP